MKTLSVLVILSFPFLPICQLCLSPHLYFFLFLPSPFPVSKRPSVYCSVLCSPSPPITSFVSLISVIPFSPFFLAPLLQVLISSPSPVTFFHLFPPSSSSLSSSLMPILKLSLYLYVFTLPSLSPSLLRSFPLFSSLPPFQCLSRPPFTPASKPEALIFASKPSHPFIPFLQPETCISLPRKFRGKVRRTGKRRRRKRRRVLGLKEKETIKAVRGREEKEFKYED